MSARSNRLTRRLAAAAAALILGGFVFAAPQASAAPTQADVNRMADELDRLENELNRVAGEYEATIAEYELVSSDLDTKIAELNAKEAELDTMKGGLRQSALKAFMSGGRNNSLATLLTSTGGLTQSVQREYLTGIAMNAGNNEADALDALVRDITNQRLELEHQQDYAQGMAKQLKSRQTELDKVTEEYRAKKAAAEKALGEALAAERQRRVDESNATYTGGGLPSWNGDTSGCHAFESASARAEAAIERACSQLGVPYSANPRMNPRGSDHPGFDCSGLMQYAWGSQVGGSSSYTMMDSNPVVFRVNKGAISQSDIAKLEPGDLILYLGGSDHHVGLYLGNGLWVHSPEPGNYVHVAAPRWEKVTGAVRPGG